ncbi:hypothetical protein Bealeia1_00483 [Candidatus Bealeia paramacronuclearis]|uniref:Heme exporter protein D n=1 Tax=Candidatus Bealeia paramacronuclearis TaxID=1921001 RepID=A0ABZ2C241_9PROT|nr:hypothetical protein [Candidatus Bealeia paramacronuclearis]
MLFEPYTFYILGAYGFAILGLLGMLIGAYLSYQKVMRSDR